MLLFIHALLILLNTEEFKIIKELGMCNVFFFGFYLNHLLYLLLIKDYHLAMNLLSSKCLKN